MHSMYGNGISHVLDIAATIRAQLIGRTERSAMVSLQSVRHLVFVPIKAKTT
jgi:hypothetical protein